MTWSDLQPQARAAILAVACIAVLLLVWTLAVSPLRSHRANLAVQVDGTETQLEQMERQIEAVPPATQAELSAWQESRDTLLGQLGPESELPLFVEALVRLSEAQGVDAFVSATDAIDVTPGGQGGVASQTEQVIGAIPGARRVPVMVSAFGDYAALGSFIAQIGRLGWVTELGGVEIQRTFPEVASKVVVIVYFRADSAAGAGTSNARQGAGVGQPMGAQGGGSHG
jgi:Tfp pilus assembly protein PilO